MLRESESAREKALSKQTQLTIDLQRFKSDLEASLENEKYLKAVSEKREKELERELQEAKDSLETIQKDLSILNARPRPSELGMEDEKETQLHLLQEELFEIRTENQSLASQNEKLKNEVRELRETLETTLRRAMEENESERKMHEVKMDILQKELNQRQKENEEVALKLKEAEEKAQFYKGISEGGEIDAIRTAEFEKRLNEKEKAIKELKEKLTKNSGSDLEGEIAQVTIENERLRSQIKELNKNKGKEEVASLLVDQEKLKRQMAESEKEKQRLKENMEKIKEQFLGLENEKKMIEKRCQNSENKAEELKEKLIGLEVSIVRLKRNVGDALTVASEVKEAGVYDRISSALLKT